MITIEDKIKLFTKIVYDRVEKENKITIDKFNEEFSNILEDKKREFTVEADENYRKSKKEIEKEVLQIVSKARVESKKLILAKERNLIEETIKTLYDIARGFTKSKEYEEYFKELLLSAVNEIKDSEEIIITLTKSDSDKFHDLIRKTFDETKFEIEVDEGIVGGVIIVDKIRHLKIDFSLASKILGSKEIIGQKIAGMFN